MVSGLVTSPCDQLRIFSGEARLIRMESKSAIRLALSYGEERYMFSLASFSRAQRAPTALCAISFSVRARYETPANGAWGAKVTPRSQFLFNPRRAPDPASRAAFSSARHRGTSSAARGSEH